VEKSSARTNRVSSLILFTTVALAPLPFGSTDPATIAFWCMVLGIGLAVASPVGLRSAAQFGLLGLAAAVILGYAFVLHEQLSAQPWLAQLHPLWKEASEALGVALAPSASIARDQPFYALGAPLAAMLAMICGFVVGADRKRARGLIKVLAWSGVAYAVFGIGSFLIDPTKILWRDKQGHLANLTATFSNRNTAAVYFGSCAIVWLVILSEGIRHHLPRGPIRWRELSSRLLTKLPPKVVLSFSMLLVCLAAMFMTGSRAGVVLSLVSLILAFTAFFYRQLPRRTGVLLAVAVGGVIALVLLEIPGAGVSGRFGAEGLADEGRFATYRSTLRLIADHPWFGTGLGTFAWSFPAYRSPNISMWGVWDRAHSTPLEIAAEVGVPLAAVVVLAWMIVLAVLIRGAKVRRRDLAIPVAALSVAVLALLHSMIDFSLQIPGYAIVVFALVGAGLAQSTRSNQRQRPQVS